MICLKAITFFNVYKGGFTYHYYNTKCVLYIMNKLINSKVKFSNLNYFFVKYLITTTSF